jgi:hypothetical protein
MSKAKPSPDTSAGATPTPDPNAASPSTPRSEAPTGRQITRPTFHAEPLLSRAAAEIQALHGTSSSFGHALVIHGVTTRRHDEARELLEDLSAAVFIELDRSYGLAGTLHHDLADDLVAHEYDEEPISTFAPRLPTARYGRDAASLYLFARSVPSQLPFLEYLGYYQVIEYYMAAFSRARTIKRVSNILKDPRFDHHDEVAVDRLIDVVLPGGRSQVKEAEQVLAAVEGCLDYAAAARFLAERPAAAKALRDTKWITGVRAIIPGDSHASLVRQIADRIYGLRCRIVHSKDSHADAEPLHPFSPEAKRLRHDLHLIRFVAQHVLMASSKPARWT